MLDKVNTFNGSTNHLEDLNEGAYDDSIEDTAPSRAVWLITFTVAMGGFLFGELDTRWACEAHLEPY